MASPSTAATALKWDLLEAARGGDQDAYGRLVEPYRGSLHAHCTGCSAPFRTPSYVAHLLNVLTLRGAQIAGVTSFLDVTRRGIESAGATSFVEGRVVERFGLPSELPA